MAWGRRLELAVLAGIGVAIAGSSPALAVTDDASDSDPENQLWDCSARHVPLGQVGDDVLRCLTFRFDPPDDIERAVLYLDIDAPTNSLQDTDALVVAVGKPFDECTWAQGAMAGCVVVHGGFVGGERSLVVDLLDLGCDPGAPVVDTERQQALNAQLATGVVHVMLQDDTAVNGAWLDINGDAAPAVCGTSPLAVPVAVVERGAAPPAGASDSGSGPPTIAVVAAAAAVTAAAGTAGAQRLRTRRLRPRVGVRRVPDPAGRIELADHQPSFAISVQSIRDDVGEQVLTGSDFTSGVP